MRPVALSLLVIVTAACSKKKDYTQECEKSISKDFYASQSCHKIDRRLLDSIYLFNKSKRKSLYKKNRFVDFVQINDTTNDDLFISINLYTCLPEIIGDDGYDGMLFIDSLNIVINDNRKNKKLVLYDSTALNRDTLDDFEIHQSFISSSPSFKDRSFFWYGKK